MNFVETKEDEIWAIEVKSLKVDVLIRSGMDDKKEKDTLDAE